MQKSFSFALIVIAIIVAGAALQAPVLGSGYLADDYFQQGTLDRTLPLERSPLDLFSFVRDRDGEIQLLKDVGAVPWWSHPTLRLRFLRPLSSALILLDHEVLGLSPFLQHVHSLLWWAALVAAYATLLHEVFSRKLAVLATLIFALDPAHVVPVGWLANRNALVSALFAVVALWGHVRWRDGGYRPGAVISGVGVALSLAGGENGLCALGYLCAYEAFARTGNWRHRVAALFPAAIPTGAYLLAYAVLRYGAVASAMYVNPFATPREFASQMPIRFVMMLGRELFGAPSELASLAVPRRLWGVLVALTLLALLCLGWSIQAMLARKRELERGRLVSLALGMLLSLALLTGTFPSSRLLLVPSIGGAALIAALIDDAWDRLRERTELRTLGTWARSLVAFALALAHVVLAPSDTWRSASTYARVQAQTRDFYRRSEIDDRKVAGQDLVLLNAPDPNSVVYAPRVRHELGSPMPRAWRALAMTGHDFLVRRIADDTLELAVANGALIEHPLAFVVRSAALPLRAGEIVRLARLEIRVLEVAPEGPQRVRYRFARALDDPSLVFLVFTPDGLKRYPLPPVGEAAIISAVTGVGSDVPSTWPPTRARSARRR